MTKSRARNLDEDDDNNPEGFEELKASESDPSTWPTRRRAAVILGVHVRTLDRMVVQKEVTPVLVEGVKRFNPIELEACGSETTGNFGEEIRETLALANDATKLATDHAKQLFSLVTTPSTVLLELLSKENGRLTARVSELENKQIESIDSLQKALELSDEREIRKSEALAKQQRLQKGIELLSNFAPLIISQITDSSKVGRLLNRLSDEQLFILHDSGVIAKEEYELILKIRGKVPAKVAEPGTSDASKQENEKPCPEPPPIESPQAGE
jgi:hypothetical protein